MIISIVYGGVQYELRDSQRNRDEIKGAARGHDAFLNFELSNGDTLSVVAAPGIPFAVKGLGMEAGY